MLDTISNGFIVGTIICIIMAICAILISRKSSKMLFELSASLPEDIKEKMTIRLVPYKENPNFLIGNSYIFAEKQNKNMMELSIYFRHDPRSYAKFGDYEAKFYVDVDTYTKMGLGVGKVVTTLHNSNEQYQFKIAKILEVV